MIFLELFGTFFLIGLFTFGGGYAMIPLIEAQVVGKGWISEELLYDFIAVSEVTPGPFAINMATFVGSSQGGFLGALCATVGVILPSFIIILLVAAVFTRFMNSKWVKGAIKGVKPIVLALISSVVILLFVKVMFFGGGSFSSELSFDSTSLVLFITLLAIYFLFSKYTKKGIHPIWMIVISALLGMLLF